MQAKVKKVMRGYKAATPNSNKGGKDKMHKMPDGIMMKNSDMTKKGY